MMRGWLRTHWFKVGLLAICVAALVAALHHQEQERNHRLMLECRGLGEKIDKEINPPEPNPTDPFGIAHPYTPEFHYNPKLKTCFYYGGHGDNGFYEKFLINAYTNKRVASCTVYDVRNQTTEERQEEWRFNVLKRALFDEVGRPLKKYEIDLIRQSLQ